MRQLGSAYAQFLSGVAKRGRRAYVVALKGDLGAGKTTFVQGFAAGLGIHVPVTSPTFVIMKTYPVLLPPFSQLIHIDAYRINARACAQLEIAALKKDPRTIIIIEWADRVMRMIRHCTEVITFIHGGRARERSVTFQGNFFDDFLK